MSCFCHDKNLKLSYIWDHRTWYHSPDAGNILKKQRLVIVFRSFQFVMDFIYSSDSMCPFHLQTLLNAFYTNSSSLSIMNYPSPRTLIDCFSIPSLSYSTIWQNSSKRLYQDLDCVFFLSDILLLSGSLDCSRIKGETFLFPQ